MGMTILTVGPVVSAVGLVGNDIAAVVMVVADDDEIAQRHHEILIGLAVTDRGAAQSLVVAVVANIDLHVVSRCPDMGKIILDGEIAATSSQIRRAYVTQLVGIRNIKTMQLVVDARGIEMVTVEH